MRRWICITGKRTTWQALPSTSTFRCALEGSFKRLCQWSVWIALTFSRPVTIPTSVCCCHTHLSWTFGLPRPPSRSVGQCMTWHQQCTPIATVRVPHHEKPLLVKTIGGICWFSIILRSNFANQVSLRWLSRAAWVHIVRDLWAWAHDRHASQNSTRRGANPESPSMHTS